MGHGPDEMKLPIEVCRDINDLYDSFLDKEETWRAYLK